MFDAYIRIRASYKKKIELHHWKLLLAYSDAAFLFFPSPPHIIITLDSWFTCVPCVYVCVYVFIFYIKTHKKTCPSKEGSDIHMYTISNTFLHTADSEPFFVLCRRFYSVCRSSSYILDCLR